jgi:NADPH-dependent 2,4-dienoyl-CoA reductase/sulfur reductase-like enzyme
MTHVVVVGAGPAGLAAAIAALDAGAEVTLLDASDRLGGQFWRHLPPQRAAVRESALHHGWTRFRAMAATVTGHGRCRIRTETSVWAVERRGGQTVLQVVTGPADGAGRPVGELVPDALVLATGAHDLTLPFPGWDLPGVYTGGAAQALAKSERIAIGRRVVVAGAGPFLLPVAASLTATGARVLGVHEASGVRRLVRGWSGGAAALAAMPAKFGELAGYAAGHVRYRIPYHLRSGVVAAHGTDSVTAVTVAKLDADWAPVPGTERVVDVDAVAVSHGFVPRLELALAAGCALRGRAFSRFVAVDDDQRTSVPGVYAAGELTGIAGSAAAVDEGTVAGWAAAGGDPGAAPVAAARRRAGRARIFGRSLDAAHGIAGGWTSWLDDATIICRCEETTYGRLCDVAEATQSRSLRSLKLTTRAGLGPCQGRICGRTVEAIVIGNGRPFLDDALPDQRPIAVPVRIGELAQPLRSQTADSTDERTM